MIAGLENIQEILAERAERPQKPDRKVVARLMESFQFAIDVNAASHADEMAALAELARQAVLRKSNHATG